MAESYKINETDITTYLTNLQTIEGSIGVPPLRQEDYTVPGRTGAVAATPWWGPRVISLGGIVSGATRIAYQANLRSLMSLVHNGGETFTLTRTLDNSGAPTTLVHTASARYLGGLEAVSELSPKVARVAFDVQLMDGYFYDQSYSTLSTSIAGTAVISTTGDAPTQDVVITYSIGPGTQRVTNAAYPGQGRLTLKPGTNTLTVSGGGSVSLAYKAAWL